MRFLLLATDYDGTLARDGRVEGKTIAALDRLRSSGRKLILVTGRHMPDLSTVFSRFDLFDRIVAENGGLLYQPATREEKLLCEPPNEHFLSLLRERNIPFVPGRTVVASWHPHEEEMLQAIRDTGLDLQVTFNKGSVMVLPSGVNKATGLNSALRELGISTHNVVAAGDAENDHSFLRASECGVAVANALPALKEHADIVLDAPDGDGVVELIDQLISDDLEKFDAHLLRHAISLGVPLDPGQRDRKQVLVVPQRETFLIAGSSGSGKSTAVSGMLEQLLQQKYQFCLVDPEGDYDNFTEALSFGNAKEPPDTKSLMRALENPKQSAIVNLLGVPLGERASYLSTLLPQLLDLRSRVARPHSLIIDEAHHMLPSTWTPAKGTALQTLQSSILITVHPEHTAKSALEAVGIVIAIGKHPFEVFRSFARETEMAAPEGNLDELAPGEALIWFRRTGSPPIRVKTVQSKHERLRHVRQYAEGELSPEQSFYFRGPVSKLNLRAQNLQTFLQLADGVDDETWMYHLRRGDYSAWFASRIKDEVLKHEAERAEKNLELSPQESRNRIRQAIESRYTAAV
jgi:HAD superfamily hydrolase (TIGR01484 family)